MSFEAPYAFIGFVSAAFADRLLAWDAVHGASARKQNLQYPGRAQSFQQMVRADDIVRVIFGRLAFEFRDRGISRKMDGGDYLIVPAHVPDRRRIGDVGNDQRTPAHKVTMAQGQIIEGDRLIPGALERLAGMRSYITRPACD